MSERQMVDIATRTSASPARAGRTGYSVAMNGPFAVS